MKKVLAISLMAALLLTVSVAVMADATNWQLIVKATDSAGMSSSGTVMIGCITGFTDDVDTGKGEPTAPMAPGPDSSVATAAAVLNSGDLSVRDFKAPIVADAEKNWTIKIYQQTTGAGPNLGTITVNISLPTSSSYLPAYNIGGTDYAYTFSGAYSAVYNAATPIANFSFEVPATMLADAAVVNLKVAPVPEPSSLVALASGLFGLVGFGIRRRR